MFRYKNGHLSLYEQIYRDTSLYVQQLFAKYDPANVPLAIDLSNEFFAQLKELLVNYDPRIRFKTWLITATRLFWLKKHKNTDSEHVGNISSIAFNKEQCPYNVGRAACDGVNQSLTNGISRINPCSKCNMPEVAEFLALSKSPKSLKLLNDLGFDLMYVTTTPINNQAPVFNCPVLKVEITEPCNLKSCQYSIDYPWAKNCLLQYAASHNVPYNEQEISLLLGIPTNKVTAIVNNTLNGMRSKVLHDAYNIGELDRDFEYLNHSNICHTCESLITGNPVIDEGIPYCSQQCHDRKLPKYIHIERKYYNTYRTVIRHVTAKFNSKELAYSTLNLDYEVQEEDPKEKSLKKRGGIRPTWLADMSKLIKRRINKLGLDSSKFL